MAPRIGSKLYTVKGFPCICGSQGSGRLAAVAFKFGNQPGFFAGAQVLFRAIN